MKPRLLANENFPIPSINLLRELGHDVATVAEATPSVSDREVLALAATQRRWLLTFDRDYGELVFARLLPAPPALLYFRLTSYRPETPAQVLAEILTAGRSLEGCFVVVEAGGLRIRPLPKATRP